MIGHRTVRRRRTWPARLGTNGLVIHQEPQFPQVHGCRVIQGIWRQTTEAERWERKIVPNVQWHYGTARHGVRLHGTSGFALSRELDSLVYAFDEASETVLRKAGLSPLYFRERRPWLNQFARKLLAVRHALNHYQHVVWLDIDALKLASYPTDFWERLWLGAPLQAKLRQYKRRKCGWRVSEQRHLCGGAFIYCRSIPIVERCLATMELIHGCDDEIAMARVIDELMGGWQGAEAYREFGYDPEWYTIRGEVWRCERSVFTAR